MEQNKRIAIGMYERSAALFADYAGGDRLTFAKGAAPAWAADAEDLALAGQRAAGVAPGAFLHSLLGRLHGQEKVGYYAPGIISSQAALPQLSRPDVTGDALPSLWRAFAAEQKRIGAIESVDAQEAGYLALLQRYCWAVPAPQQTAHGPDVSLYDFARVSAALAVCMTDGQDRKPALLVGGDLSGVQDWLYSLSSRGVAKGLRGRSFYLQLLTEAIALHLLDELGLPSCNLLYAGGGNFYLLAPVGAAEKLPAIQQDITRKLLRMHEGALYIALGAARLSREMLLGQCDAIGNGWAQVTQAITLAKSRRFAELDDAEMAEAIGSPMAGTGELADTCNVCRRTIREGEGGEPEEDGSRKCGLCRSFELLGNQLRDAELLAISRLPAAQPAGAISDWRDGLAQFGYDVQLLVENGGSRRSWQPQPSGLVRIFYWKGEPNPDRFPGKLAAGSAVWLFRPLAQCTPLKAGEIATFDQLESEGVKRWGVLRMDVDNLGKIFQEGIPNSSLSRVVGLSSLLRLYFEGHVPGLAEEYNRKSGQPRMYLMYAGGDDLFIVGGWSDLPHLAQAIRQDFAAFACQNPKLTISGGISIALGEKYPLYQAARDAGDAEHQAKQRAGGTKDALSFLGEVMGWGAEYDRVKNRVDDLRRWLGDGEGKLPRSFLMTLRAIDGEWREWKKQESEQNAGKPRRYEHSDKTLYLGPWQWHLIYSLTRVGDRSRNEKVRTEVQQFAEKIVSDEISVLGLLARWTELETRGKDDK